MPRRCRPLLGTFVEIAADVADAVDAGFAAVERVHRLMSAHEAGSDVSRINRFGHIRRIAIDAWTAQVLARAQYWSRRSNGAFDVVRAGKAAIEGGLLPCHADQPQPTASRWSALELEGRTARLTGPGGIDLGGIAKGFAVDQAVAAMRAAGAARGLVNAGGDLFAFGPEPWRVIVPDPLSRRPLVELAVKDSAVATSALVDGSARHLRGAGRWLSVTVRAANACDADALAKIAWAQPTNLPELLAEAGASAFGVGAGGEIEDLGAEALAA